MRQTGDGSARREAALALLRRLREIDQRVGVKNSRIAFDVALLFYEGAAAVPPAALSVDQIAALTGYSGPTVRLVLKRLIECETVTTSRRVGKTQLYEMTPKGRAGFDEYVTAVLTFNAG
jgi:DNA-binding MarR family transcriptional regulator